MDAKLKKKLIAPDGGWGWAIAVAYTIHFFLVSSLLASFGLIYNKTEFKRLRFSVTQSSFIVSVNGGFSMLCGVINGPLLNKFGTRKVSICSAFLIVGGLLMTAYSTTFIEFMIYYGVITSIGMGMGTSSYTIALNTYFEKKRSTVTGSVLAIFGVGTVLFPQLVSFLMSYFTVKDTMLIITAICGHTFVAAVLLQPVKRHMKVEIIPIEDIEPKEEDTLSDEKPKAINESKRMHYEVDIHASMGSLNIPNIVNSHNGDHFISGEISQNKSITERIINGIVKTFDLSLLKDLVFLNILIGLSIDFFAEFSYMVLLPFILMDAYLSVEQTATFLSVCAVADICFRLLAPFIALLLKQRNRVMYVISLILILTARSFLLFVTDYSLLLFVAVAIGAFRGMRLVHWSLVLPEYIATERLPAAFGLFFTLIGLGIFAGGPVIGAVRDLTGSYKICMILLNFTTLTTIIMWTLEWILRRIKLQGNR